MQVETLKLQNFMCFPEHEVPLADRFNLIVGNNGKGKTTILNGLAVGLGAAFLGFPEPAQQRSIGRNEVHQKFFTHGQIVTAEPQFPCTVECFGTFADQQGSWSRKLTKMKGRTNRQDANWVKNLAERLQKRVQNGDDALLPVISYYGTGRLWLQLSKMNVRTLSPETRFQGYLDCLNPASNERWLVEWFKTNELAALQKKNEIDVLEACRRAIRQCVPDATNVYFDVSLDQLVLEMGNQRVPFGYLSDGYRNMLAMAADIAVRCATLNPHLGSRAAESTPGIVLIDEIDLHLHPNWQRTVIVDLMHAFPRIQFVATTHSPFVIQSLPDSSSVQLINLDEDEDRDSHDKSIEEIAESIQGVQDPQRSERYQRMMETATQYFAMLQSKAESTEEQKQTVRRELEKLALPFADSPAYHAFIKMQELAAGKQQDNSDSTTEGGTP